MTYYIVKVVVTALLIVLISELAKRSTFAAAILASLPLVSVLAMFWLYIETKDTARIEALATSVFWLVLPSLALFVALPLLLRQEVNFYLSMAISIALTAAAYWVMVTALNHFGVKL